MTPSVLQAIVQQAGDETLWTHFGIVAAPTLMIFGMWVDVRRAREKKEEEDRERHQENKMHITQLQTMMEPMWEWWNSRNVGRQRDD